MSGAIPIQRLQQALQDAARLLEDVQESFWSSRIRSVLDKGGLDLELVLSWYGGMGSFNDLVIARVNGHQVQASREDSANRELDKLRSRIHELATQLKS